MRIFHTVRKYLHSRNFSLIAGGISILLLVILAASMEGLEFNRGMPFEAAWEEDPEEAIQTEPPDLALLAALSVLVFFVLTALALYLATPKQRKIILASILALLLAFLGILWWISQSESGNNVVDPTITTVPVLAATQDVLPQVTQLPTVIYTAPPVSPWISIGITFTVLLVAVLILWVAFINRKHMDFPLEELAGIAEKAVSDLQTGKEYGNSILNCYAAMVDAVSRQKGIRRRGNLTPEEFIAVLERARIPEKPVRQLTVLFEAVRYGGRRASKQEIDQAVTCLTEIVAAIRETQ